MIVRHPLFPNSEREVADAQPWVAAGWLLVTDDAPEVDHEVDDEVDDEDDPDPLDDED